MSHEPLKGFSCTHRVPHGGNSCSQRAKDLVLRLGQRAALGPTRTRLAAGREAQEALRADASCRTRGGTDGGMGGAVGAGGSEGAGTTRTKSATLSTTPRTATRPGARWTPWTATSAPAAYETGGVARAFAASPRCEIIPNHGAFLEGTQVQALGPYAALSPGGRGRSETGGLRTLRRRLFRTGRRGGSPLPRLRPQHLGLTRGRPEGALLD